MRGTGETALQSRQRLGRYLVHSDVTAVTLQQCIAHCRVHLKAHATAGIGNVLSSSPRLLTDLERGLGLLGMEGSMSVSLLDVSCSVGHCPNAPCGCQAG